MVLEELQRFGERRRVEFLQNPYYQGTNIPDICHRIMGIQAGNNGIDLGVCRVDFTYYTDSSREEIEKELSDIDSRLSEKLAPLGMVSDGFMKKTRYFHYAYCKPDDENIRLLLSSAEEAVASRLNVCGSCLSDLSVIAKYSVGAAFGFGMGREFGEEGGAHQPNEFIEISDLLEYTKILGTYILKFMG
jgi:acetylornithine deacetylase/succinyl-diaminopimelate desuccinylase-like protein